MTQEADDPEYAAAAVAESTLRQALAGHGLDRADDYGGLNARVHIATDGGVWFALGGRLSAASAARTGSGGFGFSREGENRPANQTICDNRYAFRSV